MTRLALAIALLLPGVVVRLTNATHDAVPRVLLFGCAVIGASLLLTWAAELAQLDLSPALAIAGLALVAVLPEYVVGATFAWRGGHAFTRFGAVCHPPTNATNPCSLALANMLGANRLLIGIGWSLVVLIAWRRTRARHNTLLHGVVLPRPHAVELSFLAIASVWCVVMSVRHTIGVLDSVILLAVFVGYGLRIAQAPRADPELEGVAARLSQLPTLQRRVVGALMMVGAAAVIFLCADAFADALVASGSTLGIDQFVLVQWFAPLASEAPELIVAAVFAWRLRAAVGLSALVSSKVNQWTVLVGSLPIAFAVASGSLHGLPLGPREREELVLTAAQSVFGVAVLGNMEVSTAEAIALFTLFTGELVLSQVVDGTPVRLTFTVVYLVVSAAILAIKRRDTVALVEDGFRTPYHHLHRPRVER